MTGRAWVVTSNVPASTASSSGPTAACAASLAPAARTIRPTASTASPVGAVFDGFRDGGGADRLRPGCRGGGTPVSRLVAAPAAAARAPKRVPLV